MASRLQLRAASAAASSRDHDDDDDRSTSRHGGNRGGNSDDDGSDNSDASDDEDGSSSARGGGTSRSERRAAKKRAAAALLKKNSEITTDRTVIHESLLRRAIHRDLATYFDAAVVPLESEIDLESCERLVLSFSNIYAIDNLAGFDRLTKLQLDNNIIDKVQNLGHLTNLTWLDLSFNNLTKIEGLDALVNLSDLLLADNEITTVEGLDTLTKLQVLDLGSNKISDLTHFVQPLRKFKKLRALRLAKNPVAGQDDYHTTIFAYLKTLTYLDNKVIESSQFAKARDAKLDQLLLLEAKEKTEEVAAKERLLTVAFEEKLTAANLGGLSTLFTDMVRTDTEHPKIRVLPGFEPLQKAYAEAFQAVIDEFAQHMLAQHILKTKETSLVQHVIDKIQRIAVTDSREVLDAYQSLQKVTFAKHTDNLNGARYDDDDDGVSRALLVNLKLELSGSVDKLMEIEMFLVEQMEIILEEFEKNFLKLTQENSLKIVATFRALTDASNRHLNNVYELTHTLLEKYTKEGDAFLAPLAGAGSIPADGAAGASSSGAAASSSSAAAAAAATQQHTYNDVDVKAILSDKDVLNSAVTTSHEHQETKIAAKEEEIMGREEGGGKRMLEDMRRANLNRNRKRVAEIYGWKSIEEAAIAAQEAQQDGEDD